MSTDARRQTVEKLLARRVQNVFPSHDEVVGRLATQAPLTIYWGIDPTGTDVHVGHTVPLLVLRELGELGHTITLLIGDFTARIGDPTGKSTARVALTVEQVQANMATYLEQVKKILPDGTFSVAYNSEWLSALSLEQIIKLMGMVTVQQMVQRDMFQERMKADQPIYLNEFLYPLMQGYDSVALRTDGEVGGNDQTFNMLMGRDLERAILQKDKFVLATYLLADPASGKKMSKSEGPLIALDDSPQEIRRKVLALDDALTATMFTLCTQKDEQWIHEQSGDPRAFKEALATELIRMYHGEEAVGTAQQAEVVAPGALDSVLIAAGVATSLSAAHRLIDQGAVEINGRAVAPKEWKIALNPGDKVNVGKGRFLEVK